MARRQQKQEESGSRALWEKARAARPYVLPGLGITLATLLAVLVFQKTENFLVHDERFTVRPGGPGSPASPDVRVTGVSRTSAAAVRRVFRSDEGRSVFVAPLEERRKQLLEIQWVREAAVSRVWPNRIDVRVSERVPQAFIRLPAQRRGGPSIAALIDADGVILPAPPDPGIYELPVLAGIREDQPLLERAVRVQRMRSLLAEIGKASEHIAELNGADLSNWKLTMQMGDRAVLLLLGDEGFGKRVERFLKYWPEIQRRAPNAYRFDLRLTDRITAVEDGEGSADAPASIVAETGVTG